MFIDLISHETNTCRGLLEETGPELRELRGPARPGPVLWTRQDVSCQDVTASLALRSLPSGGVQCGSEGAHTGMGGHDLEEPDSLQEQKPPDLQEGGERGKDPGVGPKHQRESLKDIEGTTGTGGGMGGGRRGSGENIRRVDPSGPQFWTQVLDAVRYPSRECTGNTGLELWEVSRKRD